MLQDNNKFKLELKCHVSNSKFFKNTNKQHLKFILTTRRRNNTINDKISKDQDGHFKRCYNTIKKSQVRKENKKSKDLNKSLKLYLIKGRSQTSCE